MPFKYNPITGNLDLVNTAGTSTFISLTDAPSSYSGQAGKSVSVKGDETGLEFTTNVSTDEKVKVTSSDTTPSYLDSKIGAGTYITKTTTNPGGNEVLTLDTTGLVPTTTTISTTSPLSGGGDLSANRTLAIADAAADGSTKGAATFTASDFNSSSGVISLDYTNGQAASGSNKGFLTSSDWTLFNNSRTSTIGATFDGQGFALEAGSKAYLSVPFAATIQSATLVADQTGSMVVDIWKDTYANYPPTIADTITASAKPTISSAQKSTDSTLTGWTTSISAGDTIIFNVDSCTTIQKATLILKLLKS